MPHDKNGQALKVGDKVSIKAEVTAIHEGSEYCNLSLVTVEVMFPSQNKSALSLNAKQVERIGASEHKPVKPRTDPVNPPTDPGGGATEGPGSPAPEPPSGGG